MVLLPRDGGSGDDVASGGGDVSNGDSSVPLSSSSYSGPCSFSMSVLASFVAAAAMV